MKCQYFYTLRIISQAYPRFAVPFINVLSTYIPQITASSPSKSNTANYDRVISDHAMLITKNCASDLESIDSEIVKKIELDLIHIINYCSISSLLNSVDTLCAIIINNSHHFDRIIQVLKMCFSTT